MRKPLTCAVAGLAAVLICSSALMAQTAESKSPPASGTRNPWKYYPADRALGDGGPAPKRDLSGTWAGPLSGAGVPVFREAPAPPLTAQGKQLFDANKPLGKFSPAGTNDPTVRYCDPLGVPQSDLSENQGLSFGTMPNRIVLLLQFQNVWREIWMDGRTLPTNVGGSGKDALDPKYNGYSVGHWEDDNTLVVDTTGLDERTWATKSGYPHSMDAHVEERFNRVDHNDLKITVTLVDPKMYSKPFLIGTVNFRWVPNQVLEQKLCVPSEVLEYLKEMGDPAGSDPSAGSAPGR